MSNFFLFLSRQIKLSQCFQAVQLFHSCQMYTTGEQKIVHIFIYLLILIVCIHLPLYFLYVNTIVIVVYFSFSLNLTSIYCVCVWIRQYWTREYKKMPYKDTTVSISNTFTYVHYHTCTHTVRGRADKLQFNAHGQVQEHNWITTTKATKNRKE